MQMHQIPNDISPDDLSKYFSEIGHKVTEHLLKRGSSILWKGPSSRPIYKFKLKSFNVSDVPTELKLPNESSIHIFGFDTRLLRPGAELIGYSITHIFNLSISQVIVPDDWVKVLC